jgi:hypothetical protein
MARKDAKEFTKARMFYGEGAGTRRKLIKAKVSERKKSVKDYADAFDFYVENTDMSQRVSQAKRTRRRKDTTASVGKTARGIKRLVYGIGGPSLAAIGIYFAASNPFVQKQIKEALGMSMRKYNELKRRR